MCCSWPTWAASSSIRSTLGARSIESPDYLFFDLDPFPPITFDDVLAVALHVKAALDQLGPDGYPKTRGATGMQIYVPIEPGRYTYEQVREFVGAVGTLIQQADPDRVTMEWEVRSAPERSSSTTT